MSLTTRMLAPIALIMSIALAFVAGSAYDNAKKLFHPTSSPSKPLWWKRSAVK